MRKELTLCIVYTESIIFSETSVLLGMKKRGFGEGKWNGFGGKVELHETLEEAAKREVREEAGIDPHNLEKHGVLTFHFIHDPEVLEVHIFACTQISGEPTETEEMRPQWFPLNSIPYDTMWPDDRYWLPELLKGRKFTGEFLFDEQNTILKQHLDFTSE